MRGTHSPDVVIVSLQNGVGNMAMLRNRLPGRRVLGGMVPFNVIALGQGRFHRATSGDIVIEQDEARTAEKLSVPGLKMRPTDNIDGVQWGKLLLNLNNALNALADLPLRRQLAQRPWRRLFADQVAEGLAAIRAEGIKPVSPTPIPLGWMPPLLRLPDPIFDALLGRTMKIDPEARSSMWEDLQRGRRTEVDYLQGVITGIAERRGLEAPLSRRIVELIRQAETQRQGLTRPDAAADPQHQMILPRLEMARIRCVSRLDAADRRSGMKRTALAPLAISALAGWLSLVPAHAAPPTVIPSPGYDARLQEQRAAARAAAAPAAPIAKPASPRRGKKTYAH